MGAGRNETGELTDVVGAAHGVAPARLPLAAEHGYDIVGVNAFCFVQFSVIVYQHCGCLFGTGNPGVQPFLLLGS